MKSIVDRLGKWKKAKQGDLWDWIKVKGINKFLYVGGYRIVNS